MRSATAFWSGRPSRVCDVSEARKAARERVRAYHAEQLALLVDRVAHAVDGYRAGDLDAYDADEVLHHYTLAAKALWKFCNLGRVEDVAWAIREQPPVDWWEIGTPSAPGQRSSRQG